MILFRKSEHSVENERGKGKMISKAQKRSNDSFIAKSQNNHEDNAHLSRHPLLISIAITGLCFLLTSTSWLAWEYHLMELTSTLMSDLMTMVIGYVLQAAGIGAYALLLRRNVLLAEHITPLALILHMLCMVPAVLIRNLTGALALGFLMNMSCGWIAGYYLTTMTCLVSAERRASSLGIGYGLSILGSWLLSKIDGGRVYYSNRISIICLFMTIGALGLLWWERHCGQKPEMSESSGFRRKTDTDSTWRKNVLVIGAVVLLFSVVNNSGFAFSSGDLVQGIRVETSRLFYAMGLVIAGIVSDWRRKIGAIAALSALIIPFVMLAMKSEPVSLTVFWALNYFAYGFYSVFRITAFSDIAEKTGQLPLACFGLMIGRAGDAIGEGICLALKGSTVALVLLTAVLFIITIFLFFRVHRQLYGIEAGTAGVLSDGFQSEQDRFYRFAIQHDLSSRERDVLRLLLEENSNGEIAAALSISENTVKFHIRNLFQKTNCRNRNELIAAYISYKA